MISCFDSTLVHCVKGLSKINSLRVYYKTSQVLQSALDENICLMDKCKVKRTALAFLFAPTFETMSVSESNQQEKICRYTFAELFYIYIYIKSFG